LTAAALYIDPRGPYPALLGHELCWDEARDARTYAGPWPVVAHPPCGPWGRLRFLCTKQDASLAPLAVDQVRAWGGVLEHPVDSLLWRHCRLPRPGELPDEYGGRTYRVDQVSWGHCCVKPTWLYVVGVPSRRVVADMRSGGVPSRRVTSGPRGPRLPSASQQARRRTPVAFARWLISLAEQAGRRAAAE